MKRLHRILLVCGLLAIAGPSWAATATTTFGVTATVVPTCTVSAAALNFGAAIPNPIVANVDAQTNVTATCGVGAAYSVALSAGNGAAATFASRKLTSGGNTVNYTLFSDPGRSTVWGDGSGGSAAVNGVGNGAAQAIPVFGRIFSGQSVPTGAYSDTIVVTITF